jgi:hypothetical protein
LEAGLEDEMNDKKAETPVSCVSQTGKAKQNNDSAAAHA